MSQGPLYTVIAACRTNDGIQRPLRHIMLCMSIAMCEPRVSVICAHRDGVRVLCNLVIKHLYPILLGFAALHKLSVGVVDKVFNH